MKCKQCEKIFHYCGSCGYDREAGLGFCSEKCLKSSEFYNKTMDEFKEFISTLNNKQKVYLYRMLEGEITEEFLFSEFYNILTDSFKRK